MALSIPEQRLVIARLEHSDQDTLKFSAMSAFLFPEQGSQRFSSQQRLQREIQDEDAPNQLMHSTRRAFVGGVSLSAFQRVALDKLVPIALRVTKRSQKIDSRSGLHQAWHPACCKLQETADCSQSWICCLYKTADMLGNTSSHS